MDQRRGADLRRTWALVPIRGLATAKTRLGPDLDPAARRALVEAMLRRTLVATRDAGTIAGTIVVTKDPAVAGLAQAHGAVGLVEHLPGLNEAIEAARSVAVARGATAVIVLPADIPGVSAAAIDELTSSAARASSAAAGGSETLDVGTARGLVAVVADRHARGTNALLLSPPMIAAPRFGAASRAAHRAAAESAGAQWLELDGPLALDVDTPADLLLAAASLARGDR